jgi:exopolysaccharide biosynthesis protein
MHIVLVDLTVSGIRFKLSEPDGSRETVRRSALEFLKREGAQVAINAHFFVPFPSTEPDADLVGFAASNGNVYSGCELPAQSYAIVANAPAINIDPLNHASIVHCDASDVSGKTVKENVKIWNAISGSAQIVTNGVTTIPAYASEPTSAELKSDEQHRYSHQNSWYEAINARSAIGLSKDSKTLVLFTVDRAAGSEGLRVSEMADILIRDYHVENALNLDGGGSTTLAMQDPKTFEGMLVNVPSDRSGVRRVGSSLAVFAPPAPAVQTGMPQNPSRMVEHTRAHPRIEKQSPEGKRQTLALGTLFVPSGLKRGKTIPLLFFFHGGTWLPEYAVSRDRKSAVISIQIGAGSATYARAFQDSRLFSALIAEAESKAAMRFGPITLGGWSAGCGAIRQILSTPENYDRVANALMIDGIHTSYIDGKPGPLESQIDPENLAIYVKLARDAIAGRKHVIITHTEIFPGTFASTTETADYILHQLGVRRRAVLKWGPTKTQELSEVRIGHFRLIGFAGNSAPDHVDQLHSLPEFLKWLR